MTKKPARTARTARTPEHQIPIGLQLVAKALDQTDHDHAHLLRQLAEADALARQLLEDPLIRLETDGGIGAVSELAHARGAEAAAEQIAKMIPESETHDPHQYIIHNAVIWGDAGLYLGLCLGWRLAATLSGNEAAR